MAQRIKITGFLDLDGTDPDHLDLDHESGLSEQGFLELIAGEAGRALALTDLTDVDTRLVG